MPTRDSQKSRVYRAEDMLTQRWPERPLAIADALEWATQTVLRDQWFRRNWPAVRHLEMDEGKQYAYGSFDHVVQTGHLVMPDWAGKLTVLHELAHVCVEAEHGWLNVASHGDEWASVYLRLVERHLGPQIAEALRTCFTACRVSH